MTKQGPLHIYLSTGCLHGKHAYCRSDRTETGAPKRAARCKVCSAPCVCPCHTPEVPTVDDDPSDLVTVAITTKHPEAYVLVNHLDGTRWVIRDGQWAQSGHARRHD